MNARYPQTVETGILSLPVLKFSPHAQKRMQKRGISMELVMFLIDFGKRAYSHGSCCYTFSGKNGTVNVPKSLQEKLRQHPLVVINNGVVVTAKWCYKKIKRKQNSRRGKSRRTGRRR